MNTRRVNRFGIMDVDCRKVLSEFSGNDGDDPDLWLARFDKYATAMEWDLPTQKLNFLMLLKSGSQAEKHMTILKADTPFPAIREAFLDRFSVKTKDMSGVVSMYDRTLKQNETIDSYLQAKEELAYRAGKGETEIVQSIIHGLPAKIRTFLEQKSDKHTLSTVRRALKSAEATGQLRDMFPKVSFQDSQVAANPSVTPDVTTALQALTAQLGTFCSAVCSARQVNQLELAALKDDQSWIRGRSTGRHHGSGDRRDHSHSPGRRREQSPGRRREPSPRWRDSRPRDQHPGQSPHGQYNRHYSDRQYYDDRCYDNRDFDGYNGHNRSNFGRQANFNNSFMCNRCNMGSHHPQQCPYKHKKCVYCGKKGHHFSCCWIAQKDQQYQ